MGKRGWLVVGGLVALALLAALRTGGSERKSALTPPSAPAVAGGEGRTPILAEPNADSDAAAEDATPAVERLDASAVTETYGSTVVVCVKDSVSGEPVADLRVGVFGKEEELPTLFTGRSFGNWNEVLKTDGLGQALIEVPSGRRLRVALWRAGTSLPLVESTCKPIRRGAERKLEFSWIPAGRADFYGRCVRDDDRPIGWGFVEVRSDGQTLAFAELDPTGRFRVSFEPARSPYLYVRPSGRSPLFVPLTTDHQGPENEALIETRPLAQVDVARSNEDDDPFLDRRTKVSVAVDPRDIAPEELHPDLDGREVVIVQSTFPLHVPSGADLELTVTHPTLGTLVHKEPALAPDEERTLELAFDPPGPVIGIVLDQNDRPVADVEVLLINRDQNVQPGQKDAVRVDTKEVLEARTYYGQRIGPARTDDGGRFRFENVPFGDYVTGVSARRHDRFLPAPVGSPPGKALARPVGKPVAVNLRHGKKPPEVKLRVGRDLALRGQVVGLDGEARVGYLVQARAIDGSWLARSRTDVLGHFVVGPLTPGKQELTAWSLDTTGGALNQRPREAASLILSSRLTEELRVVVEPAAEGPTLTTALFGTVSDEAGQRLVNARVRAVLPHPGKVPYPGNQLTETWTNERGAFAFELPGTAALLLVAEHAGRIGFERVFISPERETTSEWHLIVSPQATAAIQLPIAPEHDPWTIEVTQGDTSVSPPFLDLETSGGEIDLTLPAGRYELSARNQAGTRVFSSSLHLTPLAWLRIVFR